VEGALSTASTVHRARVVWEGGKRDLRAHRVELADQVVRSSCSAEWGGDPAKADPEELFVAALSSCHMLWFVALARGRRLRVRAYEDEAEGVLDGTRMVRVELRPRISFEHDPGPDVVAALHDEAHERCFIANSVNCPVEVVQP
jgi:organic hydroperoxide reductase OsmC/OhrA